MQYTFRKMIPTVLLAVLFPLTAHAGFNIGPLKVGGAIRANYVNGDYKPSGGDGPERGSNGGDMELDTYRINLDYSKNSWTGKVEYRWYTGYNFMHTGWVGYKLAENSMVKVGLNRVPFGVGAYGPANSWFFDQHYYVGLSDDMDVGVKYTSTLGDLALDLAFYGMAEPNFNGDSSESARYSYDIVNNGGEYSHYEERNQVNVRAIYSLAKDSLPTALGLSLQWGQLVADEAFADDSDAWAVSVHSSTNLGNTNLKLQLTRYKYDAQYHAATSLSNDLISMGAFDFAWPVASEGTIPSIALSYKWKPAIDWVDSITFYNDYSVIMKDGHLPDGRELNDSAMNVTGMAIASGGWYTYVDYAYSNGNYFVGNEGDVYGATYQTSSVGDFGANQNDEWNGRFNINFGYYF